ncbi:hypothetical protein D8B26_007662 [Coccidioides posadasii str. Silveira]|nr:hypothetical protein D8B26_007662 [Coccidioides posadasii str. Silveira]
MWEMGFAQARQYLSRLYRRTPRKAAESESDRSESTTRFAPATINLAQKLELCASNTPKTLDLDIADQALAQRSQNNNDSSQVDVRKQHSSQYSVSAVTVETPTNQAGQQSLSNISNIRCASSRHNKDSFLSVSQTPRSDELVPAKKLRRSPRAEALALRPKPDDQLTSRHTSNQSIFSEKSNTTVHRYPSKRCQSPIATLDAFISQRAIDPFSDSHAIRQASEGSSRHRSSQNTTDRGHSAELGSSHDFLVPELKHGMHSVTLPAAPSGNHSISRIPSNSSDGTSRRILERKSTARREFARSKAFLAFNTSAPYFGLESLTSPKMHTQTLATPAVNQPNSFLRRIRTAKSTLTIGRKKGVRQKLRRMKTLESLTAQYRPGSLTGRTLEDLSRLGGESILSKLPPRYFPGTLKLPTCIAATVNALITHGTALPFIHREPGKPELINALYSYYAGQVLGAEKLKYKINKTMRPIDLPMEQINARERGRADKYMHVISTVLKHFLAEIPGGIFGSVRLFHALEGIYANEFSHMSSRYDPGRKHYLPEIAPSLAAKVRMIALAMMALTTDAQLELIFSIFGLLAVTADESHVMKQFHYDCLHPKLECDRCAGLTDSIQLGEDFGHLLCGIREPESAVGCKTYQETHAANIATMLIILWKDISRQFCRWELIEA